MKESLDFQNNKIEFEANKYIGYTLTFKTKTSFFRSPIEYWELTVLLDGVGQVEIGKFSSEDKAIETVKQIKETVSSIRGNGYENS